MSSKQTRRIFLAAGSAGAVFGALSVAAAGEAAPDAAFPRSRAAVCPRRCPAR